MENPTSGDLVTGEGGPANVFIMYATASNRTASDGTSENGAFTEFLLKHMDTDENIDDVATAVRADLLRDPRYRKTQVRTSA